MQKVSDVLEQDGFLQEFLRYCRDEKLLERGQKVLLSLSGGLDSTVLAHLLYRSSRLLQIEVSLIHVDHQQRHGASAREAVWLEVLAGRLGLPLKKVSLDGDNKMSQAQLRDRRLSLVQAWAKDLGVHRIATAHHADDNVETFLMRAISGSGIQGLRSIAPIRAQWIRPLLWAFRQDLENYARRFRLAWVEDPSNERGKYLRNQLRREVLPVLDKIRPSSNRNISRLLQRIEKEESELDAWLSSQMIDFKESLDQHWLDKWPLAIQRRIFRLWVRDLGLAAEPALVEALLSGSELVHRNGVFLKKAGSWFFNRESEFGWRWSRGIEVSMAKRILLGPSLAWSFLPGSRERFKAYNYSFYLVSKKPAGASGGLAIDWAKLPPKLKLSTAGGPASPELKKIFKESGIPRPYWESWPVLYNAARESEAISALGLKVLPEFQPNQSGRSVWIQSFLEEV